MNALFARGSIGRQVFVGLVAGEVLLAVVIGVTVSVFSVISMAKQREESIGQVSATITAALMPMIADQERSQVEAQLDSILRAGDVEGISGICIRDAAGEEISCRGDAPCTVGPTEQPRTPWAILMQEQSVTKEVVVDGLKVAEVCVRFEPPDLGASFARPALATLVVLLAALVVSIPWSAWRLLRDLVEPVNGLAAFADRIAAGELDAALDAAATGEIGALQATLVRMAGQLRERDERIRDAFQELSEAYLSLEQAARDIEELAQVKSNFVAVAAHELRGPLATIRLYADMLSGGEMGELDAPSLKAVTAIRAAATRLSSIVSDLMDAALLERGLLPVRLDDTPLAPIVAEAVADAAAMAAPRLMNVKLEDRAPAAVVRADALRLRQVLDNLLSNALKYSPRGTGVDVTVSEDDGWVRIDVADRGRGIPEGAEGRLFHVFGRLDFGDSRDTAGLGLGLAISARIVEAHGGSLSYRPNEGGVGSVFTVRIPLAGRTDAARRPTVFVRVTGEAEAASETEERDAG